MRDFEKKKIQQDRYYKVKGRPVVLRQGQYLRLMRRGTWEYVERRGCTGVVLVVPLTDNGKTVLLEHYRIPARRPVIEFPAGLVNDGKGTGRESLTIAARRELLEETGYRARRMTRVAEGPAAAASSSGVITIFLAKGLRKVAAGGGDETEFFDIHEVPLRGIEAWLARKEREGCLVDIKIYTGLYFLRKYNKKSC